MSGFLLDMNVLIALIDSSHVQHDAAHECFGREGERSWATCPLTENAVFQIVGHLRDPNSPCPPTSLAPQMKQMCALPGHQFRPDDISLLDGRNLDLGRLLSWGQVTDSHLLALACAHGG